MAIEKDFWKIKNSANKDENINAISSKNLGNIDFIIEEYKDAFEGIGMLKDFELILHIDKSVKPVVQASRKIPYNLRQKLLEKLIELEENDIAEIVECPTTWVSPFVTLPKCSDYICIIVDMRVSNQAIKRERHPIPTVEEIIQEISGDCDFSKLDLF